MSSFYIRRFSAEFRIAAEEFVQYLRWDLLPELPRILLVLGAAFFFYYSAATVEPKDTQHLSTINQCTVVPERIAKSD